MAELDNLINEPSESEKRIKQLSSTVKTTSEERDAEKQRADAAEAKVAEAERAAQFSDSFSDVVSTNPAAKDFKDDIRNKVMSGYTVQDATYAVLGAAGKLGQSVAETASPAGGSASINLPSAGATKTAAEMTQEERRAVLSEALVIT